MPPTQLTPRQFLESEHSNFKRIYTHDLINKREVQIPVHLDSLTLLHYTKHVIKTLELIKHVKHFWTIS